MTNKMCIRSIAIICYSSAHYCKLVSSISLYTKYNVTKSVLHWCCSLNPGSKIQLYYNHLKPTLLKNRKSLQAIIPLFVEEIYYLSVVLQKQHGCAVKGLF